MMRISRTRFPKGPDEGEVLPASWLAAMAIMSTALNAMEVQCPQYQWQPGLCICQCQPGLCKCQCQPGPYKCQQQTDDPARQKCLWDNLLYTWC